MHEAQKTACRIALAAIALASGGLFAQTYPGKPIRVIVPYAAGGVTDISSRLVSEVMSRVLEQPLVIELKPGAGGRIGAEAIARAPADGYQLLYTTNGTHTYMAVTQKSLPYDPFTDFTPIAQVGVYGLLMVVHPSVPAHTVAEFIEHAKRNSGQINYCTSGSGTGTHFAGELFKVKAGIEMVHVPYKGSGPALQDVIAGNCQVTFDGAAKPFIDSGKVRFLGTTSTRRDPRFPDTPTISESGLAGYDLTSWLGMFAPAGLKPDIQAKLNAALNTALADATVRSRLTAMGVVPSGGAADVLPQQTKAEIETLRRIAAEANLRFE